MSQEATLLEEQRIDCSDEKTVQMLYQKLGRPALGKTLRLVEKSAAEEILQEVFTKLWEKQMVFPNLKSAFAWVYKCCTNAALDHLRYSQNNCLPLIEASHLETRVSSEQQAEVHQVWSEFLKVVTKDEAEVFIYRTLEGLSQDEISEVMQISRRTVNRIQEKLDQKLERMRRRVYVG